MESKEIIRRFNRLSSDRSTVQQLWDTIEQFVMPYRGRFFKDSTSETDVEWRKRDIWDSTAVHACESLAASLHGSLTTPAIRWFELRFRDKELNDDKESSSWLEKAGETVFNELQDSNFNLEINETYIDITGFGTSFLGEEERGESGVEFSSVPIKEGFFEQDYRGQVRVFYRLLNWTYSECESFFGEDRLPEEIRKLEKNPDEKTRIIFCIYPRQGKQDADVSKILAPKMRPYGAKYVIKKSGVQIGEENGYYEMPMFAPRWRTTSDSIWGHAPGAVALADILMLNELKLMDTKAREKAIDPAIMAEERALIGDLDLSSSTLNIVKKVDGIVPFESRGRFDLSNDLIDDLRRSIRSYFFVDQLELKESPAMTATEVQVRYELMQRLLGPTLGRLQSDLLNPMIQRTFNILLRQGRLGKMPSKASAASVDVDYLGPLSRAQQIDSVASYERLVQGARMIAEIAPESVMTIDWDEALRDIGEKLGVSVDVILNADETADAKDKATAIARAQAEAVARKDNAAAEVDEQAAAAARGVPM